MARPCRSRPIASVVGWALGLGGTFLDRQDYWEDYPTRPHRIIGASWLSARACMLLHLLLRCVEVLNLRDETVFLVGVRLTGTDGRFLVAERGADVARARPCVRAEVNSEVVVTVGRLRQEFRQIVAAIARDVAWRMERTDVKAHVVETWLDHAVRDFGVETLFPDGVGGVA